MSSPIPSSASGGEGAPAEARERWWRPPGALWCLVAALLLTLVMAAPVLRAPAQRLFGHETVGRYHDPYTVLLWFERPTAPTLYTQPATDYLGALVARRVGGVAAYNLVVLWSFPLAAWFTYLLAFRVSRSVAGSWFAALTYAFAPFHLAHAAYHPHVAQTQWLPLYLLALWLALEHASWRRLALLLGALALVGLSNFYGGLSALVLTPIALFGGLLARPGRALDRAWKSLARIVALFALAGGGGFGYLRAVAPAVLERPASLAFPVTDLARYTARWSSYLVPAVEHPLFGARARTFWEQRTLPGDLLEHQLTIGFGLTLLALIAIIAAVIAAMRRWRARRDLESNPDLLRPLRWVPPLALVALTAFSFSLSPSWNLFGISLSGPSSWLYRIAPMFRAHARFGLALFLAVALLAALGIATLLRRRSAGSTLAACVLIALTSIELAPLPPWRWHDVLPTSAHRWLLDQRASVRVLDCVSAADPVERAVPKLFGKGLFQLSPVGDCSEPGLPAKLAAQGFTHLIVRRASRDGELFALRGPANGLRIEREGDDAWLLAVDAPPAETYLEVGSGFFARQHHADRSYRWMGQQGELKIVNRSGSARSVTLQLTLHSMPRPRRLLYAFGSGASGEVGLATNNPTPFTVGPLAVPPGATVLQLWSAEAATLADSELHNGDQRALAVALWEWEIADLTRRRAGLPWPLDRPSGAAFSARGGAR